MTELAALGASDITAPGLGDPPYGVVGPYGYSRIENTGLDNAYDIYLPATFEEDTFLHPIINWANGGQAGLDTYIGLLSTWATWGFVVVVGHTDITEDGVSLNKGCDWIVEQNSNPDSIYYEKLDVNAIGASGHSSGGGAVVVAAATASIYKPHITVTVPMMAAVVGVPQAHLQKGPMLILTDRNDLLAWSNENLIYEQSNVLTMMLMWHGTHEDVENTTIVRNPSTAWFRLYLMQGRDGYDDNAALDLFYGKDCLYCQDTKFEILRRNMDE